MKYEVVIGLEVHVQLTTATKIFCGCSTRFGKAPNTQTCPVCLGLPGALPVLNRQVVEYAILTGLATNCAIAPRSIFARKNYFYPDLPKGYQISQFELPICVHGRLEIETEDAGAKRDRHHPHPHGGGRRQAAAREGAEAGACSWSTSTAPARRCWRSSPSRTCAAPTRRSPTSRSCTRSSSTSGSATATWRRGRFRCDANVSIRPWGQKEFGTRAELKNINSFRFIKQAIEYEIERQIELLEEGGKVVQETRLFDSATGMTRSMRGKEEAHDYRYFPDPDLVPLVVCRGLGRDGCAKPCPSCPRRSSSASSRDYGIPRYDAEVLTAERAAGRLLRRLRGAPRQRQDLLQLGDGRGDTRPQRRRHRHHRGAGRRRRCSPGC